MYQTTNPRPRQLPMYQQPMGSFTDELITEVLPNYRKEMKRHEADLHKYGAQVGKGLSLAVWGAVFAPPKPSKPFGPKWLPQVMDPVMTPFIAGVKSEVGPKLIAPIVLGGLGIAGLLFFAGFAIGKRRGSSK